MGVGVNAAEFEHWVTERDKKALEKVGGVERVCEAVGSDLKKGLCADAWNSAERKESYGVNEFEYPPPKSFLELCNDALADVDGENLDAPQASWSPLIGAGMKKHRDEYGYLEGIAIVIVVIVVVFLQAGIDYAKEMKFRQLNSIKDNYHWSSCSRRRSVAVHAGEIMVGDLVELAAGDKVPADGLFVEGKFKANEAAMTGEPIDITKVERKGPLFSPGPPSRRVPGRCSSSPSARALSGASFSRLSSSNRAIRLFKSDSERLVLLICNFGIGAAVILFIVSMIRWIAESAKAKSWDGMLVLDFLINAVTIVVVAIPEGLPLAITLGLWRLPCVK